MTNDILNQLFFVVFFSAGVAAKCDPAAVKKFVGMISYLGDILNRQAPDPNMLCKCVIESCLHYRSVEITKMIK